MSALTPRVLRGVDPAPYTFATIRADGEIAEPAPAIPVITPDELEAAFERGREAGMRERQDEVAALQDETVHLAQQLRDGIEAQKAFVANTAEGLSEQWHTAVRQLEPTLAEIAVDIAEAILEAPLADTQRTALDRSLAGAVDALAGDAPLSVTVHPVTLLHLQETGLAESLLGAHPRLRWEPDNTIAEDDWAASTPEAAIRRIRSAMLTDLRERLGLGAAS